MLHSISQQQFDELAKQGYNRIPLVSETFADLDTPLSLYLKLANKPYSYLLESVQGGERFGRYSFIGLPANTRIQAYGSQIQVVEGSTVIETHDKVNPLDFLKRYQAQFKAAPLEGLPRFTGGLAGYFGYETVRYIEHKLTHTQKPDVLGTPDILLLLTEELAVIDNLSGRLTFIVHADPAKPGAYEQARSRLQELVQTIRQPAQIAEAPAMKPVTATSEFGEAGFKAAVEKAKQYIF
ncbi:MAG TPA: anthranilate synthase component I, partial [Methylophilaceae bacterium]